MKTKRTGLYLAGIAMICLLSCQDKQIMEELSEYRQNEVEETANIELGKKAIGLLDALQLDSLGSLFAPEAKLYYQSGEPVSFEEMKQFIKLFYTSFPDYRHHIEDIYASGDKVILRMSYSGTFTNSFMGKDPTNEKFSYKGLQILQFSNDEVVNLWVVEDELSLMSQLGFELK